MKWKQSLLFAVFFVSLQLGELSFESLHQSIDISVMQTNVSSIVARIAALGVVAKILRDRRTVKLLGLQSLEARSALAVGVSVANGLLHCIGPLYQVASSPGFEVDVFLAAIHLNVAFVVALFQSEAFVTASLVNVVVGVVLCGALEAVHPSLEESTALRWYAASACVRVVFLWVVKRPSKVASD